MILLDFSQSLIIPATKLNKGGREKISVDLLRHVVLNIIRNINKKFKNEYGDLVICCDGRNYWRKKVFPYYKAHRSVEQKKSKIDWMTIFDALNILKKELKENFPYKLIEVETAEADDIIATIVKYYNDKEKILIVSSDKDFMQLQKFANVFQYDYFNDRFIKSDDPQEYLIEHIIRGDRGDCIPNILSDDDAIINPEKRQRRMTQKLFDNIRDCIRFFSFENETVKRNYARNELLIDMTKIPSEVENKIITEFENYEYPKRIDLFSYMFKHGLVQLMDNIGDF